MTARGPSTDHMITEEGSGVSKAALASGTSAAKIPAVPRMTKSLSVMLLPLNPCPRSCVLVDMRPSSRALPAPAEKSSLTLKGCSKDAAPRRTRTRPWRERYTTCSYRAVAYGIQANRGRQRLDPMALEIPTGTSTIAAQPLMP